MKANTREGFEIELPELLQAFDEESKLDEYIRAQQISQRKIYLREQISAYSVADVIAQIIQYNVDDKDIPIEERKPIMLYISSIGGDEDAGFELIDVITSSKTPVHTVNFGWCYSMGFLIYIAGKKRYVSKHAKFLMHDGNSGAYDSTSKVKDRMKFVDKIEAKIKKFVIEKTSITSALYNKNVRVEWYMLAEDAKKYGVADFIIGEDCDIDEVC